MIDGVFPKLTGPKRKGWPKFPLHLGSLVIQNSTHASSLGKRITTLNIGEAPKRMHDPKSFLVNHFTQEHMKSSYVHQTTPDDSIYHGVDSFFEVLNMNSSEDEKRFIFQYQQEVKAKVL